ncbi:glycosyltransferase family 2 protein [bacterium]|nr:glycosyltransferase family 2 protein [bacterium]
MKEIVVIIPVYNGEKYLFDCLNSLKEQTFLPAKIIVIDNASKDKSVEVAEKFKKKFQRLTIISNKKNLGFARAVNQGIKEVINSDIDYILLLNQDAFCEKKCFEKLVEVAQKQNNSFALQPLIFNFPDKNKIQTAGDRIHFLGFGYSGNYNLEIKKFKPKIKEIPYASGAAMFINMDILKKVGLFDEDLFMYHEDMDICIRARMLGYKILLVPEAIVYHKYNPKLTHFKLYWSERNREIVLLKFYKLATLFLIFPFWLIMEIGTLAYSLFTGWFWLKIKSYFNVLLQLPKILNKRFKIQKTRIVSDREILKFFDDKFNFGGFEHPLIKYLVNPLFGTIWKIIKNFIYW